MRKLDSIAACSAPCPRFFLIILISIAICSASYYSPPWEDVASSNQALLLDGYYNQSTAVDTLVTVSFGPLYTTDLAVSTSIDAAGLSSTIDGKACPGDGLAMLFSRGISADNLSAKHVDGQPDAICTRSSAGGLGSRCDFDNDMCPEYVNATLADFNSLSVVFKFDGVNSSVPFSSTYLIVPQNILAAMRDSSGADNLSVSVSGDLTLSYQLDDPVFSGGNCTDSFRYANATLPVSFNRSFRSLGANRLFLLSAPVLKEQWFRNNRFDVVVLSQSPIYHAEIFFNRNMSQNISMKEFRIIDGAYGLRELVSMPFNPAYNQTNSTNQTNMTFPVPSFSSIPGVWSEQISNESFTPSQLEAENRSFGYAYQFNSTYDGLGANDLSIRVWDACNGSGEYNETLMSRMLSFGGDKLENGSPIDPNISRGSAPFHEDPLGRAYISIGLVAVVVVLSFINYWALR